MTFSTHTETRSQQALQSYLDALLMEATLELPVEASAPVSVPVADVVSVAPAVVEAPAEFLATTVVESITQDEFAAAVQEEMARDALLQAVVVPEAVPVLKEVTQLPTSAMVAPAIPVGLVATEAKAVPAISAVDGRPDWAEKPFECLLFDVAGLTLAVPLICLGSIYSLEGRELTPLFGQPDWFLGILPAQTGNLKVLDAARWVMPERYREDFKDGLRFVISVEGFDWGIAVHQVSRSIRLDPAEVKWRTQRTQRPWLAGTVIDHMCALLDVSALAALIESGAARKVKQ
ncbi:purine-binding chemotaxis protein CheW [Pseudomonas duriflava]|uniref:Purine-binding chemotaxis protein CheW n=1 Tax=Pseudomonas duriflava TaxID=459528 RepID=A0A562QCZ2_9PSED|nr:CheW domain-containing protein [Pseudomonas duriflava]TWI53896.1 purine-binding chemotaxis protein CheW [Pseudomonas duriflava]